MNPADTLCKSDANEAERRIARSAAFALAGKGSEPWRLMVRREGCRFRHRGSLLLLSCPTITLGILQ
jgi:hypothetical protein